MGDFQLSVELRETKGKGAARKMRAAGRIPGICYGDGQPSTAITLEPRVLERLIATSAAGVNTLIDLVGGGPLDGKVVMVKELQREPVGGKLIHTDLCAVDVSREIHVSVPLHVEGEAPGVKLGGGILDHVLREIELACLPSAIPEQLVVDVSEMEIGHSLHVRDIPLPAGVTLVTDPDQSAVSVVAPRVADEEEAATEAAEEGAEETPAEGEAKPDAADGKDEGKKGE